MLQTRTRQMTRPTGRSSRAGCSPGRRLHSWGASFRRASAASAPNFAALFCAASAPPPPGYLCKRAHVVQGLQPRGQDQMARSQAQQLSSTVPHLCKRAHVVQGLQCSGPIFLSRCRRRLPCLLRCMACSKALQKVSERCCVTMCGQGIARNGNQRDSIAAWAAQQSMRRRGFEATRDRTVMQGVDKLRRRQELANQCGWHANQPCTARQQITVRFNSHSSSSCIAAAAVVGRALALRRRNAPT